jgi:Na+-transporting methylmalonyl-CoA/oxaloacetate decarboxylase beta subunit
MLFFGNILKESGCTRRLADTAAGPMNDIITILLGMTVGASTQASQFLTKDTIAIFFLGFCAFCYCNSCWCIVRQILQFASCQREEDESIDW